MSQKIPWGGWRRVNESDGWVCEFIAAHGMCFEPAVWEQMNRNGGPEDEADYLCSSHYNKLILPHHAQVQPVATAPEPDGQAAYIADLERTVEALTLSALISGEIERRQMNLMRALDTYSRLNDADRAYLKGGIV